MKPHYEIVYESFKNYINNVRNSKRSIRYKLNLISIFKIIYIGIFDFFKLIFTLKKGKKIYVTWHSKIIANLEDEHDFIEDNLEKDDIVISYYLNKNYKGKKKFITLNILAFFSTLIRIFTFFKISHIRSLKIVADALLIWLKPSKIFISDGYTSKVIWHYLSIKKNIEAYEVQHAHFTSSHYGFLLLKKMYSDLNKKLTIIIYDSYYSKIASELEFNYLEVDQVFKKYRNANKNLYKKNKLVNYGISKNIVIISQPSYVNQLIAYIKKNYNLDFIIYKMHPLDDINYVKKRFLEEFNRLPVFFNYDDFPKEFLYVCYSSTLGHKLTKYGRKVKWIKS